MEKRSISKVPSFLPKADNAMAYYLENDDDFQKALFEFCCRFDISIYNWQPYYKKDRENYDLFLHEFEWGFNKFDLPDERKPGWYLFQTYKYKGSYWNDNREQKETYTEIHIAVDDIAAAGKRADEFLQQFGMGRPAEPSYVDLLAKLDNDLGTDTCMPDDVKAKAIFRLNELKDLLWPYSY